MATKKKRVAIQEINARYKKIIDSLEDLTLSGKYLSITLEYFFLDVPLQSKYNKSFHSFDVLQVLFHNTYGFPLNLVYLHEHLVMIDTAGFQHFRNYSLSEFNRVAISGKDTYKEDIFPEHPKILEGFAKAKGTFLFDSLPKDIFPERVIFKHLIFEPEALSGLVLDTETLEFIIPTVDSKRSLFFESNVAISQEG
jgi:hypothetical protein